MIKKIEIHREENEKWLSQRDLSWQALINYLDPYCFYVNKTELNHNDDVIIINHNAITGGLYWTTIWTTLLDLFKLKYKKVEYERRR